MRALLFIESPDRRDKICGTLNIDFVVSVDFSQRRKQRRGKVCAFFPIGGSENSINAPLLFNQTGGGKNCLLSYGTAGKVSGGVVDEISLGFLTSLLLRACCGKLKRSVEMGLSRFGSRRDRRVLFRNTLFVRRTRNGG